MKKPIGRTLVFSVLALAAAVLLAETLVIKVQTTSLRREPKFYAASVATLRQGETLERISAEGAWIQARNNAGVTGWVHESAVEARKFKLAAMDKGLKTQATAGEVALAGKGFNKQVEDSYKARHSGADYNAVERMLKIKVSPEAVLAFLKKGRLDAEGGSR